jgi:hypothetical protein
VQRLITTRLNTWSLQPERMALGCCVVRAHLWLGRSADEAEAMLAPHALANYLPQWADQIFEGPWLPELMARADPLWLQMLLLSTLGSMDVPHYPLAIAWLETEIQSGRLVPKPITRLALGISLAGDARGAQLTALLGPDWCYVPELAGAIEGLQLLQAGDHSGARQAFATNGKALRAAKVKWAELLPPWLQQLELLRLAAANRISTTVFLACGFKRLMRAWASRPGPRTTPTI